MKNYKDMSQEELDAVYLELVDELVYVLTMKDCRAKIDAAKKASAEMYTEKLIARCKVAND